MNPEQAKPFFDKLHQIVDEPNIDHLPTVEELDQLADSVNPQRPKEVDSIEVLEHYEFEPEDKSEKPFVPPPAKKKSWMKKWEEEND